MKSQIASYLFFVSAFFLFNGISYAQDDTIHITSDAIWAKDTIEIEKHIVVDSGVTLTIEAGAYVEFQGHYGFFINGSLFAQGNAGDSIVFKPSDINIGWIGIRFDSTSIENDSSVISFCRLDNAKNSTAVNVLGFPKININNCSFRSCNYGGLYTNVYLYINNSFFDGNTASRGGGVCSDDSLKLTQCVVRNNQTTYQGGGIYCKSNLTMKNCIVSGNICNYYGNGGGISSEGKILLEDCEVINNRTRNGYDSDDGDGTDGADGGGIYCNNEVSIINSRIDSNMTGRGGNCGYYDNGGNGGNGGGIFAHKLILINSTVQGNSTGQGGGREQSYCQSGDGGRGGGIFASNELFSINSFICGNSTGKGGWCKWTSSSGQGSGGDGGGIYISAASNSKIINSVMCNNIVAPGGSYQNNIGVHGIGSAIRIGHATSSFYLTNCTFCNNIPNNIISIFGSTNENDLIISNCILWDNSVPIAGVTYSTVKKGHIGVGNITANPSFVDSANNNWAISANSPCINAGTPDTSGLNLPAKDIADNPRVFNGIIDRVDMGAYEYQGNPTVLVKAGDITVDEIWYTDTVKVVGDVTILDSVTLTVNPSVYVEFQGNYKINVEGRLLSEGTDNDSIIFTIYDTTGFTNTQSPSGGWHGFRFDSTSEQNDSSKIRFCRIEYCKSIGTGDDSCGGALFVNHFSKLLIEFTSISHCTAFKGGGVFCRDSSHIAIEDCKIKYNFALQEGGGVWCANSDPLIKNTVIEGNKSAINGGGIWCNLSNLLLENSLITKNNATKDGGGICCWKSGPLLVGNIISNNVADTGDGGGIFCDDNTSIRIFNNTVTKNIALDGDGIYGGIGCNVVLINSTFWNYPDNNNIFAFKLGCKDSVIYSAIAGGYSGVGNISNYPVFKDTTNGNWSLFSNSPCINSGNTDTSGLNLPKKDIAGNVRIYEGKVDIGAYEFKYSGPELVNPISDLIINEDTTEIIYSDLNTVFNDYYEGGALGFSVFSNSNSALINVTVNSDSALSLIFASNAYGIADIVIKSVNSLDSSVYDTFTVTVLSVNDAPSFTKGSDHTILEDAGAQTISVWATNIIAGPPNESAQVLTFNVSTNNDALFSQLPLINVATGTLSYSTAANAFGSATVSVILKDNGGTANGGVDSTNVVTFIIAVDPVNDAPSFTKGLNQTVNEDAGAQTVSGWATGISAGPANENAQTLTFTISTNNDALFSQLPAIDASGALTYAPDANAFGTATVSIVLKDNGGTANGGFDSTGIVTFDITVNPVNDAPVINQVSDKTIKTGLEYTESFTAIDVENDVLTWFLISPPIGMIINQSTGLLTWTPQVSDTGLHVIKIGVKDASKSDTVSYNLLVDHETAITNNEISGNIADNSFCAVPNPANLLSAKIQFFFATNNTFQGELFIYDALGNLLYVNNILIEPCLNSKRLSVFDVWNLTNKNGQKVEAGTYLALLRIKDKMGKSELIKLLIGVKE